MEISSIVPLSLLTGCSLAYLFWEYRVHQRTLATIPHRIHVNGTRGKSSVTRLIGAGLRGGGLRVVTKVTGTFPRLILEEGEEVRIHRRSGASILEQLAIIDHASARNADALVIECMALEPQYQRISEHQMVRSTMGVMTNIRLDHIDVMGETAEAIGQSMGEHHAGRWCRLQCRPGDS